ncbi:hypothetical protein SLU01_06970 [Sporosarcina luteola]|uniref:DUF5667 domain-containing protein n=1 Tax=Sporosarcina luteola TaxID=582850 RepID=A0A511Z4J9_9BACL|nr:hypothetical protein [Sporosarcina luteola]GEN82385.1 hypothetical protein SLU01_06970 [Sporosarcina luteola]
MQKLSGIKKYVFVSTALMLFFLLGNGIQSVLAETDIGAMMKNWFSKEQSKHLHEVQEAISSEKEILLAQLQLSIDEEKMKAQQELEQFKQQEIANRIGSLRDYAANLAEGIASDTSAEKAAIIAELDAIFAQAAAQMDGAAPPSLSPPSVGEKPEEEEKVEGEDTVENSNEEGEIDEPEEKLIDDPEPEIVESDSDEQEKEKEKSEEDDSSTEMDYPSSGMNDQDDDQDFEYIFEMTDKQVEE